MFVGPVNSTYGTHFDRQLTSVMRSRFVVSMLWGHSRFNLKCFGIGIYFVSYDMLKGKLHIIGQYEGGNLVI
jgi:hypothetical protein